MDFRTRIAPTPSGYLHLGNAWSFLYTWLWARSQGGKVFLRMDTMDVARLREAYFIDIETQLRWLGLDWDKANPNQSNPKKLSDGSLENPTHFSALKSLIESKFDPSLGWAFACLCSREEIKKTIQEKALEPGLYPGTCRHRRLHSWKEALAAPVIRWHIPEALEVRIQEFNQGLGVYRPGRLMGDVVIRTRTGQIAYHLGSLADDQAMGISHIVRGKDLLASSAAQMAIASAMGYSEFSKIQFVHHPLLTLKGVKLSKSSDAPSLKSIRELGHGPQVVWSFFAKSLGLPKEAGQSLHDLLSFFPQAVLPQGDLPFEEFQP